MPTREYFYAYSNLKKWDKPRHPQKFNLCPETGEYIDNVVLVVAPPDYPQLAEGLEIGGIYEFEHANVHLFQIAERSIDNYFHDWCVKLVSLVTKGRKLEGKYTIFDWCVKMSELVEDGGHYPKTEGRGPFWEFLRYSMRRVTFGPVVCKKLVADFDKWEPEAWALGDFRFYQFYLFLRDCFDFPGENGFVVYPSTWYDLNGKPYREPQLGADPEEKKIVYADDI